MNKRILVFMFTLCMVVCNSQAQIGVNELKTSQVDHITNHQKSLASSVVLKDSMVVSLKQSQETIMVGGVTTSEQSLPSNKVGANSTIKNSEKTNSQINNSNSEQTPHSDSSPNILLIIVILWFAIKVLKRIFSGRCPKCKKFRAMKVIDEEHLGVSKTKWEKDKNGESCQVYYNKVKVTCQCKYCGYREWHKEVQKG